MGWEQRNGGFYYYRKSRQGERVVSEYVGQGEWALTLASVDKLCRDRQREEREIEKREIEALEDQREKVYTVLDRIQDLTHAVLLANGYHTHKGQWRKRRERKR